MGRASNNTIDVHVVQEELIVSYQTATGVNGGNTTQNAWTLYPLNTVDSNSITGATTNIGSSEFTLPVGDYIIPNMFAYLASGARKMRLYNVTDAGAEIYGDSNAIGTMNMIGEFTLASSKTFKIEYYLTNDNLTGVGLGSATGDGSTEIYGTFIIKKIG